MTKLCCQKSLDLLMVYWGMYVLCTICCVQDISSIISKMQNKYSTIFECELVWPGLLESKHCTVVLILEFLLNCNQQIVRYQMEIVLCRFTKNCVINQDFRKTVKTLFRFSWNPMIGFRKWWASESAVKKFVQSISSTSNLRLTKAKTLKIVI